MFSHPLSCTGVNSSFLEDAKSRIEAMAGCRCMHKAPHDAASHLRLVYSVGSLGAASADDITLEAARIVPTLPIVVLNQA